MLQVFKILQLIDPGLKKQINNAVNLQHSDIPQYSIHPKLQLFFFSPYGNSWHK
jgi:hypothetical protein